jgi:poly-gamma-glutamate synthesis protein (capsule biosynthesis protein)
LDRREAEAPAALTAGPGRVLVFACGAESSGIPPHWAAGEGRPGVHWLADLSKATVQRIGRLVGAAKRPGDLVVVSLHWGGNWGYAIPRQHREFAHGLIDRAGVDVIHGHSSHHPLGIEVHRGKPILYGCGDLLNDYEGIAGKEEYRGDLALMYFVTLDASTARLTRLDMTPLRIRRFRLQPASREDAAWLRETLDRECARLGGRVEMNGDGRLGLRWEGES